jgi:large subunit ribosomal protein L17
MRHRVDGRKLGRTSAHRLALLRNLSIALIEKERITTTLAKAKELRRFAEKLVTLSKRETLHSRRRVLRHIPDRRVVAKLFDTLSARYSQRPGGYTRILKLGPRRGDSAEMALIEFVSAEVAPAAEAADAAEPKKKAAKPGGRGKAAPAADAEAAKPERKKAKAPVKKKKTASAGAAGGKAPARKKAPAGRAKSGSKRGD